MPLTIEPAHPTAAARIHGLDLTAAMTDLQVQEIEQASGMYPVLIFPNQWITDDHLMAFAEKAKGTNGYHVVLQGFTDSTGNAEANQRLSRMRAETVANFLQQKGGLMPGKVHGADGMGVATDAGTGSNANARKVVVKLVVDKGVSGGN